MIRSSHPVAEPADDPQGAASRDRRRPELLAPAGDWDCAKAAVENGADAIYFGLEKFNARMRAHNFTEADLPRLLEFLHRRGVRGYLTFNTLVFENEMAEAEDYLRTIITAGVDAAVVQDVGICRLIRRLSPDFPIHVSTQMTITSAGGVAFARDLGCDLVVLARECSLKEIAQIQRWPGGNLPLEVFVHGALCVAYSGQCLTSEALGGRSANRGECAQACRMPYELLADGVPVPLGDRKYLLSPRDLAGLEVLPELARLGVASLKIEGRLKSPEYVANITRVYRQALDALEAESGLTEKPRPPASASPAVRYEMEMAFSRGLHTGWFAGTNHQALVHGRFGTKRGVYLGVVTEVRREGVVIAAEGPIKPGDGVVFDAGWPEEEEQGGRVYEIRAWRGSSRRAYPAKPGLKELLLGFGRGDIDFNRVHEGDKLWKTSDPELERRLRQSYEGDTPKYQRPLRMEVHGVAGQPLALVVKDDEGHVARCESRIPLSLAQNRPLTRERLCEQLGRLGGTSFRLGDLESFLQQGLMLPLSELNRLRRDSVGELERLRAQPRRWTLLTEAPRWEKRTSESAGAATIGLGAPSDEQATSLAAGSAPKAAEAALPELIVLVRSLAQLEVVLVCGVTTIYCELEDPKAYREAVRQVRSAGNGNARREIFVAPPRIFKHGEEWTLKQVRSSEADGYLVRNYDHLDYFSSSRRIGDYTLNIANRLSAEYFKQRFGLERVTASYDLNFAQLEALLRGAPADWFEVTIHQHMPMFHMEHCLFCAFLSQGSDYTNCGRPCDRYDLKLRDRVGAEHPVKADAGCRNTVFNARAQTGADFGAKMAALGVRYLRLEFLNESPDSVRHTLARYRELVRGEISAPQLWRELKLLNQLGVTRGQIGK